MAYHLDACRGRQAGANDRTSSDSNLSGTGELHDEDFELRERAAIATR